MRRPAHRLGILSVLLAVAFVAFGLPAASASALNLSGTWAANYHCEVGGCAGSDIPRTDTLTQAQGSNAITGTNGSEELIETLTGNSLAYESRVGGYSAKGTLIVSSDGLSWSGRVADSNGTEGTYTAKRTSGGGEEGGKAKEEEAARKAKEEAEKSGRRPTATSVICNYEFASSQNTCGVSVGDGGAQPPVTPTGTVSFTTTSGGFANGATCSLTATPGSPQVAACTIVYETAYSGLPAITATYAGDSRHAGSSGHTQFLGGEISAPNFEAPTGPSGQYPDEVSLLTEVPIAGTTVEAAVQGIAPRPGPVPLKFPPTDPRLDAESIASLALLDTAAEQVDRGGAQNPTTLDALNRSTERALERAAELQQSSDPAVRQRGQAMIEDAQRTLDLIHQMLEQQTKAVEGVNRHPQASSLTAARRHRRSRGRPVKALAYVIDRGAPAGKLKLRLHLNRAALAKLAGRRHSVTVLVRIDMFLPGKSYPHGVPRVFAERVVLKRAPAAHRRTKH